MIDARVIFGNKFIQDQQDKSHNETDERLKIMGPAFIKMVGLALNHAEKEKAPG